MKIINAGKILNSQILVHFKVRFGTRLIGFVSEWISNFHEVQQPLKAETRAIIRPVLTNKTLGKSRHAPEPTIPLLASQKKQLR